MQLANENKNIMAHSVKQQMNDIAVLKNHIVEMMFYPEAWKKALHSSRTWIVEPFPPSPQKKIPPKPGVYVFVVQPQIFDFIHSSGLFYIGKATNLYQRISSYIGEIDKDLNLSTRPMVWSMVNQWNGHLNYYYTITKDVAEAEDLEKEMLNAFIPYFNRQYPAEISVKMRAFK